MKLRKKYLSGEMGSQRKKCRIAKFPEVEEALLKWFKNKGNNKITELRTILQRESKNS